MAGSYYLSILLALVAVYEVSSSIQDCSYKDPKTGKVFNMSPLISSAGYYTFTQSVWSIGGFSLDSLVADTKMNVTFYVQVCRNIMEPPVAACNVTGAIYSVAGGECQSWGDANVAVFDPNPYQDGVNIKLYHGSTIDHLNRNQAIIFFVCNKERGREMAEAPYFEHIKAANNQAHFKFFTKYAC